MLGKEKKNIENLKTNVFDYDSSYLLTFINSKSTWQLSNTLVSN